MGWWVALGVVSLILRHGAGAEGLAWSVLFALSPFSAVYYPVSVLPAYLRPISLALPSAHVFEGMRAALAHGSADWERCSGRSGSTWPGWRRRGCCSRSNSGRPGFAAPSSPSANDRNKYFPDTARSV